MKLNIAWGPEAPGLLAWNEAVEWAGSLGEGWRLPTIGELRIAYEQKVDGFASGYYWSSSEFNFFYLAWLQSFVNGLQYNYSKDTFIRVRACRDVDVEEKE